jgi:spore coat polysaccharide biosynthesis protein SpsF (cytidylyltransferase family)
MIAQGKKRGKGIFQDVRQKFENITKGVQKQAVDLRDKVVDAGTQAIAKPTKVSAKVRGILKTMGDKPIVSAEVVRSPVQSVVQQAINFVSGGEFKKAIGDAPYDTIFHLMIVMTLEDGKKYSLEKNAIITLRPTKGRSGESMSVSVAGLTLKKALEKTEAAMGDLYATYSAKSNNCQDFILAFLKSNDMGDEKVYSFVKQDVGSLFGKSDFLRKFTNTVTDIGAKVTTLIEGEGTKSKSKVMNPWIKFVKAEAERKGISYRDALRSPDTKEGYKNGSSCMEGEHHMPSPPKRVRKGMESSQAMLAQVEQVRDLAPKLLMEEVRKPRKKS